MKGMNNNEQSINTLQNLINSLNNRVREIYNQGYREGYLDGVFETKQSLYCSMMSEFFGERRTDE